MKTADRIARFTGPLTLLEWGGILLYFYWSGRIQVLLHPSFHPQVLIAGLVLLGCGLLLLVKKDQPGSCGCSDLGCEASNRSSLAGSVIFPLMLLLPMGVAALANRDGYGAAAMTNRSMVDSAKSLPGVAEKFAGISVEPALPAPDGPGPESSAPPSTAQTAAEYFRPNASGHIPVTVVDLLYAADEESLRKPLAGKQVEVIGQIMKSKLPTADGTRFKLVRMFMVCCAADARPVSVLADLPAGMNLPPGVTDLTWARVRGEMTFPEEGGKVQPVIRVREVEKCDPPEDSMLF